MKNAKLVGVVSLIVFVFVFVLVPAVQAEQNAVEVRTGEPVSVTLAVADACPVGCECLTETAAKEKFGSYERCSNAVCANGLVPTSSNVPVPRYCFRKASGPAQVCPSGCSCLLPEEAEKYGYGPCGNTKTICGAVAATGTSAETSYQKTMYCYARPATGQVCPAGSECMTEQQAKEKYRSYSLVSKAPCGYEKPVISTAATATPEFCIRPNAVPVTPSVVSVSTCRYDPTQKACTGTCGDGTSCSISGTAMNMQTGETVTVCGCPAEAGCSFDYATDTCTGSCPSNTGKCQVNTIYRDTSGKTLYGKCHCKGSPVPVSGVIATPCAIDAGVPAADASDMIVVPAESATTAPCLIDASGLCQTSIAQDGNNVKSEAKVSDVQQKPVSTGTGTPVITSAPDVTVQTPDIIVSLGDIIRSFFGLK